MFRRIRRPREERSFVDADVAGASQGDPQTATPSDQPAKADDTPAKGDWFGDLRQSRTNRWKVRHR